MRMIFLVHLLDFYPRSPCGERLSPWPSTSRMLAISIHALLAESDTQTLRLLTAAAAFLSTLSLRRATQQPAGDKQRT